ncbi:Inositol-phosphate phosphatase [Acidimicrobium ferrooxidans DSM 10331]|uniref:Inositol-1-monophosphatase n=1 Tax=Acidimicrobium ferrooxidans (strain DSM 10331 / JCM 15462 / NBRC 103882 / ICP) TaxID=525909 RepID=C7LXZ0_ACIFD|nr:inositol monophosphatase family protein [Acidimicrobium ferrooxidans]ACU53598.1 Inositol-phosphate phosphatase [Acidimicrobium ferrooxidans DSM 10331]
MAPPIDHPVLDVALAALDAGRQALWRTDSRAVLATKSSRSDPVTATDRAIERAVRDAILGVRPHDLVVGEEFGSAGEPGRLRWLVDPIDGTVNFTYAIPYAAISIAALDASGALVGVVWDLGSDETFIAVRGQGAWLGDTRLAVRPSVPLADALVGTGFAYDASVRAVQGRVLAAMIDQVRDVRRFGAAALDLCWTAAGRLDAYFETGLKPWDEAAGALVVREAGGLVATDLVGIGDDALTVAGPPGLFEELSERLGEVLADVRGPVGDVSAS